MAMGKAGETQEVWRAAQKTEEVARRNQAKRRFPGDPISNEQGPRKSDRHSAVWHPSDDSRLRYNWDLHRDLRFDSDPGPDLIVDRQAQFASLQRRHEREIGLIG